MEPMRSVPDGLGDWRNGLASVLVLLAPLKHQIIRRVRQKRTPLTETSVSSASSGGSSPFDTPISVGIDGSTPATSSPSPRALFPPQTLNPRMPSALDLYIADVSEEGGGFAKAGEGRARSEAKRMFELLPLERREERTRVVLMSYGC